MRQSQKTGKLLQLLHPIISRTFYPTLTLTLSNLCCPTPTPIQTPNGQTERCPSGDKDAAEAAQGCRTAGGHDEAAAAQVRAGGEACRGSAAQEGK